MEEWGWKVLQLLFVAACVAGILWMLGDWADRSEEKAEAIRLEAEAERAKAEAEAEAEHAEEVKAAYDEGEAHGWNMLLDVIKYAAPEYDFSSFLHPDDLREEVADGEWTVEELLDLYEDFYYEMYDVTNEDPKEWEKYCEDTLDYSWYK